MANRFQYGDDSVQTEIKYMVTLLKGDETYCFLYDEYSIGPVLVMFGRFAENPELNFDLDDARICSQQVVNRTE